MKDGEIVLQRLRGHRLWAPACDTPEAVLHHFAAMQSQEFTYAKWSVAQRTDSPDAAGVGRAFAEGTIVRTHMVRPTWHFVLAADIRWMLAVTAPRVNALNAFMYRKLGLDNVVFTKSQALFKKALKGNRSLTRTELSGILLKAGIAASGFQLAYIVMRAELDGVICSGALRGKQHTYALLDERIPETKMLDRDEGLAELTRRYFTSRGPATMKDYLVWSSLTSAEGKRGLDAVKSQLQHVSVGGRTYWFAPWMVAAKPACPMIDLVQAYDEYIMSYSESRDLLRTPGYVNVEPIREATFMHGVLLDGRVIGRWRHALKKEHGIIEARLDRTLDPAETRALDNAVGRYAKFLKMPVTLALRPAVAKPN